MEFRKEDFWQTIFPAAAPILVFVALICCNLTLDVYRYSRRAAAILFVGVSPGKLARSGLAERFPRCICHHAGSVPASPIDRFPAPGFRSARRWISVASIAHCRRLGRFHGVGLMRANKSSSISRGAHGFIYAVICEELGLSVAMIVIALFVVYGCEDACGLRCATVLGCCAGNNRDGLCQALINFAVVLGMVRRKGSRPFIVTVAQFAVICWRRVCVNISQRAAESSCTENHLGVVGAACAAPHPCKRFK